MKFKRGVIAVAAVAGLMVAGAGTASAQPLSSGSVEVPAGIDVPVLLSTFFFGPDSWPNDGCVMQTCSAPGSSLNDFGSSVLPSPLIGSGSASTDPVP